jgi:hypothetical protein
MLESLANKTVLVTVGSSGQRAAEAEPSANLGSRMFLADVRGPTTGHGLRS